VGGALKTEPEDFRVDEIPAYSPKGEGTHLFVRFEKRDLDTKRAVDAIARGIQCDPRGAGFAGMKDRRAVTTQWASFEGGEPDRALALSLDGIRILEAAPHPHKLRTGHLKGNRFELRIRGATPDLGLVRAVLARLSEVGCPNYFGAQRFGYEGKNVDRALRWIVGGGKPPRKRFERKLLVSSLQAALFNTVLGKRVEEGLLARWVEGDLLKKVDTGGMFIAENRDEEQGRLDRFEVSPTGPMFGAKMRWPAGEALAREESVLSGAGLDREHLGSFRKAGEGTRRVLRIRPGEVAASLEDDVIHLSLTLDKGAYATVITREITKS
jgi:tRNA pseudouridine13 synthase